MIATELVSMTEIRARGSKFFAASNGTSGVIVLVTASGEIYPYKYVGVIARRTSHLAAVNIWPHRFEFNELYKMAIGKVEKHFVGYRQDRRCKTGWRKL